MSTYTIMKVFGSLIYIVLFVVVFLFTRRSFATPEEDEFVKHFGNDVHNTKTWPEVKTYYDESDHVKLKRFVAGIQKRISSKWEHVYFDVEDLVFKKSVLKFQSPNYQPMRVEVLGFKIRLKQASKKVLNTLKVSENDSWYMMQGLKKDCVYYLTSLNADADQWEFNLDKQVCGIKKKF